ncbi:putative membrane protein [Phytophthora megakarya]|uniref:Putative membrane protein n=1 Tax=Phytophthora megakarya TaxID=4795 RepID=A0A225W5D9_9STRA|nr:putative membrane protein [Phytophthora megakarya]
MATSEDRRRRVRQLVLEAAKARANDALTLKSEECNKELFAPFSPSPVAVIDAVWTKIEDAGMALTPDDLLVDLGCGDGRWLVSGVQRFNCNAFGVELDENLVKRAKEQVIGQNLQDKIQVELGDVMQTDISNAKLVIVYAFAESLHGIAERLKQQLRTDAYVLSIGFRVPEWKPHWSEREGGMRWYLYRMSDCA